MKGNLKYELQETNHYFTSIAPLLTITSVSWRQVTGENPGTVKVRPPDMLRNKCQLAATMDAKIEEIIVFSFWGNMNINRTSVGM